MCIKVTATQRWDVFFETRFIMVLDIADTLATCLSGSALVSINEVTLRRAWLVLGWVTICRWGNYPSL